MEQDSDRPWRRLAAVAVKQHMLVTATNVSQAGLPSSVFADRVQAEGWHHPHRNVWLPPCHGDQGYAQTCMAAVLACGQPALLTGPAALHLSGLLRKRPEHVDVLAPLDRSPSGHRGICVHRSRTFDMGVGKPLEGVPATMVERMFTDASRHLGAILLARVIADADRLRQTTLDAIEAHAEAQGRFPGAATLRRALAGLRGELTHSNAEQTGRRELRRLGLRPHPRPYELTDQGVRIAEIDIAFPPVRYGTEIDGPHHLIGDQPRQDRSRDRRTADLDWRIDRFLADEILDDPVAFAQHVRRVVAERTASLNV